MPIADDKDTNVLLPKMYISSFSENPIIDESLCAKIIDYYCEQYNKREFQYISSIEVRDLFGYHSYNINLTQDLSVLYGANGLGKTTLLRIIECIFSRVVLDSDDEARIIENISYLLKTPFKSVIIRFRSGESAKLEQYLYKSVVNLSVVIQYHENGKDENFMVSNINNENLKSFGIIQFKKLYKRIEVIFPNVHDINKFLFVPVNRINNINDIKDKFKIYIIEHWGVNFDEPRKIDGLFSRITVPAFHTHFESELKKRIHNAEVSFKKNFPISKRKYNRYKGLFGFEDYFTLFNGNQNDDIRELNEYNTDFSQKDAIVKLDNLCKEIENSYMQPIDANRLKQEMLRIIRSCIIKIKSSNEKSHENIKMIEDSAYALEVLGDFCQRYKLFKDLFEGFYYEKDPSRKKIVYERYLHLKSNSSLSFSYDKDMDFDKLSSGEINLATILYYLVFKAGNGAIVLIDEPEVSLHIAWQEQLIDAIKKINEFHDGMQVIIASHSPFLTAGNEEFFVDADLIIGGESNEK